MSRPITVLIVAASLLAVSTCAIKTARRFPPPPPPPPPIGEKGTNLTPAYNAVLSPKLPAGRNYISRTAPTQLTFFIGPPDPDSSLPPEQWTVNPTLVAQPGRVPLSVTMNCAFCTGAVQKQPVTYDGVARVSSRAQFQITPSAKWSGTAGEIVFSVATEGVEFDRVTLPVSFQNDHPIEVPGDVNVMSQSHVPAVKPAEEWKPDALLTIALDASGAITIRVQGVNEAVQQKLKDLGDRHLLDGAFRPFRTAEFTLPQLSALEIEQYLKISAVVQQNDALARQLLHSDRRPGEGVDPVTIGVKLPPADGKALLERFCEAGTFLHAKLFADPDLQDIVAALEDLNVGRPLRLKIDSAQIYAPWQYLHPVGDCDPERFWGFKFEITANPLIALSGGAPRSESSPKSLSSILFLAYKGDTADDQVRRYAIAESEEIAKRIQKQRTALIMTDSSASFGTALKDNRANLDLLVVFAHATTGARVVDVDGVKILAEDPAGPRIILTKADFVKSTDVYRLRTSLPRTIRTVLENRPIVFLNACETGALGAAPLTALGFPGTFLELGARAVVTTEAPVWALFGHRFGQDFTDALITGHRPSLALLELRKKYLAANNPLGLLYTYYGDGVTVFN